MSIRTWLLKNLVLPMGDIAFQQRMMTRLRFLETAQWWDRDRLLEHRDLALTKLIRVAYDEVPFYRNLMKRHGLRPPDIKSAGDLRKLPVVTKDMLSAGYPSQTTRHTGFKTYQESSSGSTGQNFYVMEDFETAGWHRASFLLALLWAGWKFGEPHLQTGMTLDRRMGRNLKDALLRCHYVSAYDLSDAHLDETLEIIEHRRINHVWGYPGSLYWLARRAALRGWNRSLRSIVTWGDNLYPHYRQAIEQSFGVRVTDTYGCAEGIQVSAQCGQSNFYHTHTLDVIVECVDDRDQPVPAGEPGNLILTRLHPGPMPLIRYQVGDVGTLAAADYLCSCGRGYLVMESIQGRDTDVVITPSGNRLIVHFFTGVLEHFPEIKSFQVIQNESDRILLRVVPGRGFTVDSKDAILRALNRRGASDLQIEIELTSEIPLPPSGKRRFVISRISKPFVSPEPKRNEESPAISGL